MTQQLSDITDTILHHGRPLKRKSKSVHTHILGQAHGFQHLRPEHARVTNLEPLLQTSMVAEDLHGRLGVRVVGGLEAQVGNAHVAEEVLKETLEATKSEAKVGNDTFNLVELGQVSSIDSFVTEDTIDGEVARRTGIFCKAVEGPSRDCGGMCAEDKAKGFIFFPWVSV